jgi:hypothetical protein
MGTSYDPTTYLNQQATMLRPPHAQRPPRPASFRSRNRKLEIQRTAAPLLCGCDFVGDFAVDIEELNNRHAAGVDAQDEAIASVGILDA